MMPEWINTLASRLWHAPGKTWAGMMKAGDLAEWFQAGAAMAMTLFAAALVYVFRDDLRGSEPFWIIETTLLIVALCVAAIMGYRGLSAHFSKTDGFSIDAQRGDEPPKDAP